MTDRLYLLDTGVLLALIRGNELGKRIDANFGLTTAKRRPLVSIVTHGEIWVLARWNNWGPDKCTALETMLTNLVPVDINHQRVIDAYVEIDLQSRRHPPGAIKMGKNDLWIAACARAAGAYLLTCDDGFGHLFGKRVDGEYIPTTPSPGPSPGSGP